MGSARRLFACVAGVAAAIALQAAPAQGTPPHSPPGGTSYVAIGDSYSAGLGIPVTTYAGGCYRSDRNFPSLLAVRLRSVSMRDVSCSGATPANTVIPQRGSIAPQFDALGKKTDLVTVRIGVNQGGMFGGLVSACPAVRHLDPTGSPCRDLANSTGSDAFFDLADSAGAEVAGVLAGIAQRSPRARVVLVGYPRLAPEHGTCPALPLAAGDYAYVNSVIERLDDNLARAARAADINYVDMWTASRGHDICAADPWVQGATNDNGLASAYHPLEAEQQAVVDRISRVVFGQSVRAASPADRGVN